MDDIRVRVKLLHPQPGDILVLTGVDLPPSENQEEWARSVWQAIPEGVKVLVIENENADVRLEREE